MSLHPLRKPFYLSPEDYLAGEAVSPIKHEYKRGQVYAMSGVTKPHAIITSNLTTLLNSHLRNSPCLVQSSDMKVRLQAANCYYYPDVSVTCDKRDIRTAEDAIFAPLLIIEVLSKSTAAFDKGEKFTDYQTLSSLQEYVLVTQTTMQVEVFRRLEEGDWAAQRYGRGEEVEMKCIEFRCAIEEIYRKVPWLTVG